MTAPKNLRDLRGRRFGKLLVLDEAERYIQGKVNWLCQCDCGERRTAITSYLTSGTARACGGKECRPPPPPPPARRTRGKARVRPPTPPTPHDIECKRAYEALIASGGYWRENRWLTYADAARDRYRPPEMPAEYAAGIEAIPFVRAG